MYYLKTFERHKEDLKTLDKSKYRFNEKIGKKYISIIQKLKHYKGELAGKPILLEDWQKKLIHIAFGWQKLSIKNQWIRRFGTVFVFIPRKNGKTLLASAITIADMIIRGEQGNEVVFFATKRDQAKLAWSGVEKLLLANKELKKYTKIAYSVITISKNDTTFKTLGRDSGTEDGLNIGIGVADEYHAHPDDGLYDVVESSQAARRQPLMLVITTAGSNIYGPCFNMYTYAKNILENRIEDNSFFAFVSEPDKNDDPELEATWKKANPNFGISVSPDDMAKRAKTASERPEKLNNFLTKSLNKWVNQSEIFIPYDKWEECQGKLITPDNLIDGLDLSINDDFSSRVSVCKKDGYFYVYPKFYLPEKGLEDRERKLKVPLLHWVKQGYITITQGDSVDYDYIVDDIQEDLKIIEAVCYDPYRASFIVKSLEKNHGFNDCIPISQTPKVLSAPTKYLLDLVRQKRIIHGNNPVMNWMIANMAIVTDTNGNIKPDKSHPSKKIDGVAAFINTLAYLIIQKDTERSPYENREVRFV